MNLYKICWWESREGDPAITETESYIIASSLLQAAEHLHRECEKMGFDAKYVLYVGSAQDISTSSEDE